MMHMASLLAVALCLATLSHGAAAASIKGTRTKGYTFNTDVSNLYSLSDDFCGIFGSMFQGNVAAALNIYYNGTSSKAQSFATLAGSEAADGRQLYNMLFTTDALKTPADINSAMTKSVESRDPFNVLSVALTLVRGKIMFDFLDLASKHINNVPVALRDLDSAWVMHTGKPGAPCPDNVFDIFSLFGGLMGTSYRGVPDASLYIAWTFGDAQNAIRMKDNAALLTATAKVASIYAEFILQFELFNALSIDLGKACGSAQLMATAKAENYNLLPMLEALLKGMHVADAKIATIRAAVDAGSGLAEFGAAIKGAINGTSITYPVGVPDIAGTKLEWATNHGIDLRNCTAM